MKKITKKGFTLIELLAIIVILAIIAVITVPIILDVIDNARRGAIKDSAYGYKDAINKYYVTKLSEDQSFRLDGIYTINDDGTITGEDGVTHTIPFSGNTPIGGSLEYEKNVLKSGNILFDGYTAEVVDGEIGTVSKGSGDGNTTSEETYIKIVYLDPTDLTKECNESNSVSATGTKTGCMKFYAYAETSDSYDLILDHNTTALVAWNSNGDNSNMLEAQTELDNLVSESSWQVTPRLITADEIADITGASLDTTINWSSSEATGGTSDDDEGTWFYFDGSGTTYAEWQTQVATTQGASEYAWLYDNTSVCANYGCNIEDNNEYEYATSGNTHLIYGYWTSTASMGDSDLAWFVNRFGRVNDYYVDIKNNFGIRPVITVSKSVIQ